MAYSLKQFHRPCREMSFEHFRAVVAYVLLSYLSYFQPDALNFCGPVFRHTDIKTITNSSSARELFVFQDYSIDLTEQKGEWFNSPFRLTVYWYVQHLLRLGGYINEES